MQHRVTKVIEEITKEINNEEGLNLSVKEVTEMIEEQFLTLKSFIQNIDLKDTNTHKKLQINCMGVFCVSTKKLEYEQAKGIFT